MDFGIKEQLRAEYETTGPEVTIEGLCEKYRVSRSVLGDTSTWQKVVASPIEVEALPVEVVEDPKPADLIQDTKMKVLANVKARVEVDGHLMSLRDLKEAAGTLDLIEKSYTKSTDTGNINIIVQNIVSKFTDDV